jgi:hypothetical protein
MIDRSLAGFLEGAVGIHVGTRNADLEPNGARAVAAAVEGGGSALVVYLARVAAERLLPDLEANGQAAVSFGRPIDERACQVKGVFESARDARDDERARVAAQWDSFQANLELIGISREAYAPWITWPCVAIRLRVTALFEQTPKPGTGGPIP